MREGVGVEFREVNKKGCGTPVLARERSRYHPEAWRTKGRGSSCGKKVVR